MTPQQDYIWALYDCAWRANLCSPVSMASVTGRKRISKEDRIRSEATAAVLAKIERMASAEGLSLHDIGNSYDHDEPTRQKAIVQFSLWEDEFITQRISDSQKCELVLITETDRFDTIYTKTIMTRRTLEELTEGDLTRMALSQYQAKFIEKPTSMRNLKMHFSIRNKRNGSIVLDGDDVGYDVMEDWKRMMMKHLLPSF